jgi:PIN domain nuclease of toxin-antitoxin system
MKIEHLHILSDLPFYHEDRFDRIIICQAICEACPIISKDSFFDDYGIQREWEKTY